MLRQFIVKVSVLDYFPIPTYIRICFNFKSHEYSIPSLHQKSHHYINYHIPSSHK